MAKNLSETNKEVEEKNRIAAEYLEQLIYLIKKHTALRDEQLKSINATMLEKELLIQAALNKNISHALTLLAAAQEEIKKTGPSAFSDYLITSAMSYVAKYLPDESINHIVNIFDHLNNHSSSQDQTPTHGHASDKSKAPTLKETTRSSVSEKPIIETTSRTSTAKKFDRLMSCISTTLLTPETSSYEINNKQIVIDFAADKTVYSEYGKRRATKLGANLIQTRPDQFSAATAAFTIEENTTLTLIGHCTSGCDCLSDNSGRTISASEIARQIYLKMSQSSTALDTEFTIDLIACQAASANGNNLSFAEQLVNKLSQYGINNAKVVASPTIMTATADGSQANMSKEEENAFLKKGNRRFSNFFSSSSDPTFSRDKKSPLKVNKLIFRATPPSKTKPRL